MAGDALVSLGVVLAGIAILTTGWLWFDPAISLIIVVVVVVGTWQLLKDSLNLSLDAVPHHIEPAAVRTFLHELPGVAQVHDLHIWAMSTTETALTVNLVMPQGHPGDRFLAHVARELDRHFGIEHSTIQIEIAETIAQEIGGQVLFLDPLAADWLENLRSVSQTLAQVLSQSQILPRRSPYTDNPQPISTFAAIASTRETTALKP